MAETAFGVSIVRPLHNLGNIIIMWSGLLFFLSTFLLNQFTDNCQKFQVPILWTASTPELYWPEKNWSCNIRRFKLDHCCNTQTNTQTCYATPAPSPPQPSPPLLILVSGLNQTATITLKFSISSDIYMKFMLLILLYVAQLFKLLTYIFENCVFTSLPY